MRITIQGLLYKEYYTRSTTHGVLYKEYYTRITKQGVLYKKYYTRSTMQGVLCKVYYTRSTTHGVLYTDYQTRSTVQGLLYKQCYTRVTTGCFKKSFSHYFLIYRWKSMKLQKYFGYTIVNNILKSQKLSIILLGFIGLAPNEYHLNPYIFFKCTAKFNNYAFAGRPRTGPDFFANANLYLRNVLGFMGKHPIHQITPEKESWGLKSGLWGARSNFWFFTALFSAISFLSATVSFCFVCI